MSALPKAPLDYVDVKHDVYEDSHVTIKGSMSYADFMAEKVKAKNSRIQYLEEKVDLLKIDLISAVVAVVGLLLTLSLTMYQWLVVCHGQAPTGF